MGTTDPTTEKMMQDTGHNCIACPSDVRNLYAVASNAVSQWDTNNWELLNDARLVRKMNDLRSAVTRFKDIVEEHFKALHEWRHDDYGNYGRPGEPGATDN